MPERLWSPAWQLAIMRQVGIALYAQFGPGRRALDPRTYRHKLRAKLSTGLTHEEHEGSERLGAAVGSGIAHLAGLDRCDTPAGHGRG
jgi:hypothetical protein